MQRKLFCEINRTCYRISLAKEILRRNLKDLFSGQKIARERSGETLPVIVKSHSSILLRKLHGVDIRLQENKVTNMIHWLVLNSPLTVTELHHHSDALFPDDRRRVPFGTGTSVAFNSVDYRFKNTTDQDVQLLVWCENGDLCGELRTTRQFPNRYRLSEENHHFRKENGKYYRISQVYRTTIDRQSGKEIQIELILNNHSEVIYDYSLIPKDQIKDSSYGA